MATSRRVQMTPEGMAAFLDQERVLHLGTVDEDGWPAVVPVWFVWHDDAFWIWNLERASRTPRLRDPATRVSVCVDGGEDYGELRGVSARTTHTFVADDDVPVEVRRAFSRRYLGTDDPLPAADHHQWLRLDPTVVQTWDFRRLAEAPSNG